MEQLGVTRTSCLRVRHGHRGGPWRQDCTEGVLLKLMEGSVVRPRNCIEYRLFPLNRSLPGISAFKDEVEAFVDRICEDYIWQRDAFTLCINENLDSEPILEGSVHFGDAIVDEWLVVYILRELTRIHAGLAVHCADDDGELLLIEAAEALPEWLTPDTAQDRVFFFKGSLHIIPPSYQISSISSALKILRQDSASTLASKAVHDLLSARLDPALESAQTSSRHYSRLFLHRRAALILQRHPELVSGAVEAFYHRDPLDLALAKASAMFPPERGAAVCSRVRFTRCLYAQMVSQQIEAEQSVVEQPERKQAIVSGRKLMFGMEVMFVKARNLLNRRRASEADVHRATQLMQWYNEADGTQFDAVDFEQLGNDDSVSWMELSPEDVDNLAKKYTLPDGVDIGHEMASKVRRFMGESSGLGGVGDREDEADDSREFNQLDLQTFVDALKGEAAVDSDEDSDEDVEFQAYMQRLEAEISSRERLCHGFERVQGKVDEELNLVKNFLGGFSAEGGEAGPISSLMHSLGVHIPDDELTSSRAK